jgi:hypothetical protein
VAVATLSPALVGLLIPAHTSACAKSLHPDYQLLRGEVQRYGDWLVGCDNQAECELLGFPTKIIAIDGDAQKIADMSVRISFSGEAGAAPVVAIRPVTELEEACASVTHASFRFKLSANGRQSEAIYGYTSTTLIEAEAHFLLNAYEKELKVAGVDPETGRVAIRFPDDRFQQAYVAMQKRRSQLLREMEDKAIYALPGELPDGSTMPVAGKHRRRPAKEVMVSGFAPIFANKNCAVSIMRDMRRYIFSGGAELWSYGCDDGLANQSYWQMAPTAMALAAPLDLPEPRDGGVRAGTQGLENAIFDWDFGILRSYQYQPGRADCGTFRAWGYTDNGWQLLERREMPLCKGIQSSDWIRTHYTPTDGPGPDE